MSAAHERRVRQEMEQACQQAIRVADEMCGLMREPEGEPALCAASFFHSLKAYYLRCLADCSETVQARMTHVQAANEAYQQARGVQRALPATHPCRLGHALSRSAFLYEVAQQPTEAVEIARTALDDAVPLLDTLDGASQRDAMLIMQLLRDNLAQWSDVGLVAE